MKLISAAVLAALVVVDRTRRGQLERRGQAAWWALFGLAAAAVARAYWFP